MERCSQKILLVDDEAILLKLGERILTRLGYRVITATGGREACEIYRNKQNPIDLIILDCIMPEMDGEETLKALKKIDPDVKVLLTSGCNREGHLQTMLDLGIEGFIQKPYGMDDIADAVRQALTTSH